MILIIVLISLCQLGIYIISNLIKLKHAKSVILLLVMIGHLFIFPGLFFPKPEQNNPSCGMPTFAVTLIFWIFGTLFAFITHLLFYAFSKKGESRKVENEDDYLV
ncbi:MAG: hypothetical protein ACK4TA_09900 [Saprospiraceae bacterium]